MNRILFAILVSSGLITGLDTALAQTDEKLPAPQAPYLAPVPDYGHWKVTFKYPAEAPQAAPAAAVPVTGATTTTANAPVATPPKAPSTSDGNPTSIETIKTGDLRGVTLTYPDGSTRQFTCQGDWVSFSTPKGPQLVIATPTSIPYIYYTPGFIFLEGTTFNLSTFKETEKHNGILAFHYKSGDVDLWTDIVTMLPLAAKQSGVEASYEFMTPPPRPFPIPKDQAALIQKEQAAHKTTSSMR